MASSQDGNLNGSPENDAAWHEADLERRAEMYAEPEQHPLGYEPHGHRTLAVDFDGVIHSYTTPWQSANLIPDPPVPGVLDWLVDMTERFRVVIHSTRATTPEGIDAMRRWLYKHLCTLSYVSRGTAYDLACGIEITAVKPAAIMYVDDRAWHFDGKRLPTAQEVVEFVPWGKAPMFRR